MDDYDWTLLLRGLIGVRAATSRRHERTNQLEAARAVYSQVWNRQ